MEYKKAYIKSHQKNDSLSNDVVILTGISNIELRFDGWYLSTPAHRLFN